MDEGLRYTQKSKISSVAHELLLTLSFCAGCGCAWMVCKDMPMSGSFGVLTTKLDGTKCYNKYKMFSMNVRRRLKAIPQWGKKFSLKWPKIVESTKTRLNWYEIWFLKSGVPPNSVLFGGTVPPNSVLFGRTVPPNSFPLISQEPKVGLTSNPAVNLSLSFV